MNRKRKYTRNSDKETKEIIDKIPIIAASPTHTRSKAPPSSSTPVIQKLNQPIKQSPLIDDELNNNKLLLPLILKKAIAKDYFDVNHSRDMKIFDSIPVRLSLAERKDLLSTNNLTIEEIFDRYINHCILNGFKENSIFPTNQCSDILKLSDVDILIENFQKDTDENIIKPESMEVCDNFMENDFEDKDNKKGIMVELQEKLEYTRGMMYYFDELFDRYLLYKHEKPIFNRLKSTDSDIITNTNAQSDQLKNDESINISDQPSSFFGIIPLLRLYVKLPWLLEKSGLKAEQINKINNYSQEFLNFVTTHIISK